MIVAKRPIQLAPGESELITFALGPKLAAGETLTGTTGGGTLTVTCTRATGGNPVAAATGDLTITAKAVNTAVVADDGENGSVAIGEGVQARITGQKEGGRYFVVATCVSSGGNTKVATGWIECRSE